MYFKIDTCHEIKLGLFNILQPPPPPKKTTQKRKKSNEKTPESSVTLSNSATLHIVLL